MLQQTPNGWRISMSKNTTDNKIFLTVFTPAYNRAHTITRTYESLCRQSNKNFVWMVIDDGSSDNTAELIKNWQAKDNGFEIRYIYKENGGMHTAHNTAYENITTELNTCIDSDDYLADEAVQKIYDKWQQVKDKGYAGLIGNDTDFDGKIIGDPLPGDWEETTLTDFNNKYKGDKKLVYRTAIIKQYMPYPTFDNEKFFALGYAYALIDKKYKLAVLHETLCNVEYQADGSSRNMFKQYVRNPKGFAYLRKYHMQNCSDAKELVKETLHYISSSILSRNGKFISESPKKTLTLLLTPFGIAFSVFVKYKAKQQNGTSK